MTTPEPTPDTTSHLAASPSPILQRARLVAGEAVDVAALRARRLLRRQLTRARSSDSVVRRRAYLLARQTTRRGVNALTHRQLGWVATLWRAQWLDGTRYAVEGWAYERGYGYIQAPQIRVWLQQVGTGRRLEAAVEHTAEMEINGFARQAEFDYANTGFRAVLDLAPLVDDPSDQPWQVRVEVRGPDGRARQGTLKYRHRNSSARVLGARTVPGGMQLVPSWRRRRGLYFSRRAPVALATDVHIEQRTVTALVEVAGVEPVRAELVSRDARRPVHLVAAGEGRLRASAEVPETWVVVQTDPEELDPEHEQAALAPDTAEQEESIEDIGADQAASALHTDAGHEGQRRQPQSYRLVLVDADGDEYPVATALDQQDPVHVPGSGLLAYAGGGGRLVVADASAHLVVTDVTLTPGERPRLHLTGSWSGALDDVVMTMTARRQTLAVDVRLDTDGSWSAQVDLMQRQWAGPEQLPRTGTYTLRASDPHGGSVRVMSSPSVVARTPEKLNVAHTRMRLEIGRGRALRLRVGVTRSADELGSFHQRRMDAAYLGTTHEPEDSIYFESFYGRSATCNPHAIDRVVAREHPELRRYWGVTDLSITVPEGAVAVVEGTQAWFDARARSRFVVANDWLRRRFVPQPFQTVLQTWHGSMFKRIGLDRPEVAASTRAALETERDKWDILLSQNRHSSEIFTSAYAWEGPLYEEGYPRNDALTTGSGEGIRELLGIRPEQTVLLYAPTWRDNEQGMRLFLDLEALTADLGEDYVVLLRGHTRTLGHGASVEQRGVIDVSTYPHITDLFLAADAMITDYSSVMFDYSVTRRPMIFYTPDLDAYRDDIRGVYFDLAEEAPGPVVATQTEVITAIQEMGDSERYEQRYAAWVAKFNTLDDGRSAERVVQRLLGEGDA